MISNIMSTLIVPSYHYYLTQWEIQEIYRRLDNNETLKNIRQEFKVSPDEMNHLYIMWDLTKRTTSNINGTSK